MIVGIPKGLLHCKYNVFFESFFKELGSEIVSSEDTNKEILNLGAKFCVDDACLPVKIFHGHVASISEKADVILIPRIMQLEKREYICPKFCGLPEMVVNSVPNMPKIISEPIYNTSNRGLYKWAKKAGLFESITILSDKLIASAISCVTSNAVFPSFFNIIPISSAIASLV